LGQAAGIAAARGIEMSSHLFPEISAHLLAATPTAHWLEYVDWGDAILEEPLQIVEGAIVIPNRVGSALLGMRPNSRGWKCFDIRGRDLGAAALQQLAVGSADIKGAPPILDSTVTSQVT
jgi:hypothetical protein